MNNTPVPVYILGGFLGSGKTTLLNKILKDLPPGRRAAVILNEAGEVSIDGMITPGGPYTKKEITGGCVCCTLKERFIEGLLSILEEEEPDAVYVESTGLAVPWEMKQNMERYIPAGRIRTEQVLVCVDASQFRRFHERLYIYQRQFEGTPHVLLTKKNLYSPEELEEITGEIRREYPRLDRITPVEKDDFLLPESAPAFRPVDPLRNSLNTLLADLADSKRMDHPEKGIVQITLTSPAALPEHDLAALLEQDGPEILRAKAVIAAPGENRLLQYDGERLRAESLPPGTLEEGGSALVLFCSEQDREELEERFTPLFPVLSPSPA